MENKDCTKCGEEGNAVRLVADDGDMSSVIGGILCGDCYDSLLECISEMLYPE